MFDSEADLAGEYAKVHAIFNNVMLRRLHRHLLSVRQVSGRCWHLVGVLAVQHDSVPRLRWEAG